MKLQVFLEVELLMATQEETNRVVPKRMYIK